MTLSVSTLTAPTEFDGLAKDWNRLLLESPRPVPFLSWEWISTWFDHFGRRSRLFILVVRDGDAVVGIAPLHIVSRRAFGLPVRSLEFLGYRGSAVCADHLDFLSTRSNRPEILDALVVAMIASSSEWDRLDLADLAEDSEVPERIARHSVRVGFPISAGPPEICPYLPLAPDWQTFLQIGRSQHRSLVTNIKRKRTRLAQRYHVQFTSTFSPEDVPRHFETLATLHEMARRRRGQQGNFHRADYRRFHEAVAARMMRSDQLYLARLECDNRPVAAWYGFHFAGTLFYYQSGFDTEYLTHGVGDILLGMILEDAITRLHAVEFDFLRGTEAYKYRWTHSERRTRTIRCWGSTPLAQVSHAEAVLRAQLSTARRMFRNLHSRLREAAARTA